MNRIVKTLAQVQKESDKWVMLQKMFQEDVFLMSVSEDTINLTFNSAKESNEIFDYLNSEFNKPI